MNVFPSIPLVHFDFGAISALEQEVTELGLKCPLLITDQGIVSCGLLDYFIKALAKGWEFPVFKEIPENPTEEGVEKAYDHYKEKNCDGLVALGGGSVIDSAKAVALLAGHPGPLSDYYMQPEKITSAAAPIIAVPTTAGTGSEVTSGAGIHPDAESISMPIKGRYLQPKIAICDPEFILSLPSRLTAGTGMDAFCHCVEGFLSASVNPPIDAIALDGIGRVLGYIERSVNDGSDKEARWHMLLAALEGGMCIEGKGLSLGHAFGFIFSDQGVHHGALVTVLLPSVLRFIEERAHDKLQKIAEVFGLNRTEDLADAVQGLNERLGLPATLEELGYRVTDHQDIAERCSRNPFTRNNPYIQGPEDFETILGNMLS